MSDKKQKITEAAGIPPAPAPEKSAVRGAGGIRRGVKALLMAAAPLLSLCAPAPAAALDAQESYRAGWRPNAEKDEDEKKLMERSHEALRAHLFCPMFKFYLEKTGMGAVLNILIKIAKDPEKYRYEEPDPGTIIITDGTAGVKVRLALDKVTSVEEGGKAPVKLDSGGWSLRDAYIRFAGIERAEEREFKKFARDAVNNSFFADAALLAGTDKTTLLPFLKGPEFFTAARISPDGIEVKSDPSVTPALSFRIKMTKGVDGKEAQIVSINGAPVTNAPVVDVSKPALNPLGTEFADAVRFGFPHQLKAMVEELGNPAPSDANLSAVLTAIAAHPKNSTEVSDTKPMTVKVRLLKDGGYEFSTLMNTPKTVRLTPEGRIIP